MGWTYTFTFSAMRDIQPGLKHRMRELSLGPIPWGFWTVTHHDGSCWAAMAFDGPSRPENMVGWAAVTEEYDVLPVVGAYVAESHRGRGLATTLVTTVLQGVLEIGAIHPGAEVYAAIGRWAKYQQLAERCGLYCLLWE